MLTGALEVQKNLLNDPPELPGVQVAVSWRPHGEVSGDFYDFNILEEDSFGITIGDVSGKGYTAALLMVYALAQVRARLKDHQRLAYIMASLDESLEQYSAANKFAEVLTGIYILPLRRFLYVQGGGIWPLVFHCNTNSMTLYPASTFRVPGFPLRANRGQQYAEASVDLEKGDVLLLFTDGVSERLDNDGKEIIRRDDFGSWVAPSLNHFLKEHGTLSAKDLIEQLLLFLDSLESELNDDQTIIVLKAT